MTEIQFISINTFSLKLDTKYMIDDEYDKILQTKLNFMFYIPFLLSFSFRESCDRVFETKFITQQSFILIIRK